MTVLVFLRDLLATFIFVGLIAADFAMFIGLLTLYGLLDASDRRSIRGHVIETWVHFIGINAALTLIFTIATFT